MAARKKKDSNVLTHKMDVEDRRIAAFEDKYVHKMTWKDIAEKYDVTPQVCINWTRSDSWRNLREVRNVNLHNKLIVALEDEADLVANCAIKILRGEEPDSKIANAQVSLVKLITELGADPVNKKGSSNVQINNITSEKVEITPGMLEDMSSTEMMDYCLTGKEPKSMKVINPEE